MHLTKTVLLAICGIGATVFAAPTDNAAASVAAVAAPPRDCNRPWRERERECPRPRECEEPRRERRERECDRWW
ncbi:hypothetical protein E2P81_ATG04380 [Venturia nashicola]|uniref:Uncharacterized protein n=1 Tax=Venturia nashicola TaxID=86259 RepID=A0A4Z1PAR4_9PEZI|nr:hypothetical protein E6O75_ATG04483 [Venturia nashicola]TLD37568.1 hypothetical protein E2P81_ATG04380 [Venturia nashicola]